MNQGEEATHRCPDCGAEYVADVGNCGTVRDCSNPRVEPIIVPDERVVLSGPQIAYLARYYPDGADIAQRGEFSHVQPPDGSDKGELFGGELRSEPGMAGCIGMTRHAFLTLPEKRDE